MHTQSLRGYHNTSLLLSPQVSLSEAPFLGAQGGDLSSLYPLGSAPAWGLAPGPYLILWPFLVSWSIPPMRPVGARPSGESEHPSEREHGKLTGGSPPCTSRGFSTPTWPSQQSGSSRLESRWGLQKCYRNQYTRNQVPH